MNNLNFTIETQIAKGRNKDFIDKRKIRISEAISFEAGTRVQPKKSVIDKLVNGKEIYFLKPGKEAFRENPNLYDMYPCVACEGKNEVEGYAFDDIWEYLIKISIINQLTFKKVLTIIYRLCYFYDHIEVEENKIRYKPNEQLTDYLNKLDFSLRDGFADKFKKEELGLFEFLHFIDLLGWNEDVKYNTKDSEPFIGKNKRKGRVNYIINILSFVLRVNDYISNLYIDKNNIKLIFFTLQKFIKSSKNCPLDDKVIIHRLSPFVIR